MDLFRWTPNRKCREAIYKQYEKWLLANKSEWTQTLPKKKTSSKRILGFSRLLIELRVTTNEKKTYGEYQIADTYALHVFFAFHVEEPNQFEQNNPKII